jgi:quinol monooxygenase YgiN
VKPSNVVEVDARFELADLGARFKLADLGRASRRRASGPFDTARRALATLRYTRPSRMILPSTEQRRVVCDATDIDVFFQDTTMAAAYGGGLCKTLTRFATFHARPGHGEEPAGHLLHAATFVAELPGCEMWLVDRDQADPETIRICETWASQEQSDAALNLREVREHAAQVMALLSRAPDVVACEPRGGARVVRSSKGATAFAILDAADLSKDSELLARYGLQDVGEARYVREQLAPKQIGLTLCRRLPNRRQGWAHRHSVVEEIYVTLNGSGRILVDEQSIDLAPLVAVRIAPASVRGLEAGPDGLEVLAFGSHSPGDGEMVAAS